MVCVVISIEVWVNKYVVKYYILVFENGYYGIVWFVEVFLWEIVCI